jgi:hypothetical protein
MTTADDLAIIKRVAERYEHPTITATVHYQDLIQFGSSGLIDHVTNSLMFKHRVTDRMRANSPLALSACLNLTSYAWMRDDATAVR